MYQLNTTQNRTSTERVIKNPYLGKEVVVDTLFYNRQVGVIARVRQSPFYGETEMVAYVVGQGWTDYLPLIDLCDCTDCGRMMDCSLCCPECGLCLSCCDCTTPDFDAYEDEDYGDYQPVRMYWQGFWI